MLQEIRQRAYSLVADKQNLIVLLAFIVQALFSLYRFFPTLGDLNLWDEASYVNNGRLFALGIPTTFQWNPLTGILYALTYLPFRNSPYWMMQSTSLGRIVLFGLMWWSTYLIAKSFKKYFNPVILVGILFCTTVLTDILDNPSDALFAGISGLAFWKLISYYQNRKIGDLAWSSGFIGLAALSRNDGLLLFASFVVICLFFLRLAENRWKLLLAAFLPFAILVGGYLLFYRLVTGQFVIGTLERSYVAFQQGELQIYKPSSSCSRTPVNCAVQEAQRLYGTPQENDNSILRAILRNPQAFLGRIINTLQILPGIIYSAYQKRIAYAIFILALAGIFGLIRKKQYALLGIFVGWIAYLAVYFVTFFRIGYLESPFFILFTLSAMGVELLISSIANRNERIIWTVVSLFLLVIGLLRSLNYLYFDMIVLLGVIWIGTLAYRYESTSAYTPLALIVLSGGLILRGSLNPPQIQAWGNTPEEKASILLQKRLPENSLVAAEAWGVVYASRMEFYGLAGLDPSSIPSVDSLHSQLVNAGVKAIYVDGSLTQDTYVWDLIKGGIGTGYEEIFNGDQGSILVLLVKP